MLATEPAPERLPCPVYARWGYDYAQQDNGGRYLVGGGRDRFLDDEWSVEAEPTEPVQRHLDGLVERFAGRPLAVTHRWAGLVAYTATGDPVCELVEPGVAVAGAYNGTGNLVGPIVARAATALALGEQPTLPA
jgi:glycine/D-amino acid oxidase-like deaminating enzyme